MHRATKQLALRLLFLASTVAANGQGTIQFNNLNPAQGVNAPVYESDGQTKLAGTQFMAGLLVGSDANALASVATTGFLTGLGAGYFDAGTQTLNNIPARSPVWVQVDVWNTSSGNTFANAQASGLGNSWWQSQLFKVTTGDPNAGGVPIAPGPLTGLGTSPVFLNSVPEPSALGLVILGCSLVVSRKLLNELMKANRRCQSPLQAQMKLGGERNAQSLRSAAFAYRLR